MIINAPVLPNSCLVFPKYDDRVFADFIESIK